MYYSIKDTIDALRDIQTTGLNILAKSVYADDKIKTGAWQDGDESLASRLYTTSKQMALLNVTLQEIEAALLAEIADNELPVPLTP